MANLPRVSERVEQAHIVRLLRTLGGHVYVLGTVRRQGDHQGTMQTPGLPDLLAFLPSRSGCPSQLLMVECKARGGRLRPAQALFQTQCAAAGVHHLVGGLDNAIAWLVSYGYLRVDQVPYYRTQPVPAVP